MPVPYEQTHPGDAAILAELCAERMALKVGGVRLKPLYLTDPEPVTMVKVGRNAPCPCGSGQKHKRCCLDS